MSKYQMITVGLGLLLTVAIIVAFTGRSKQNIAKCKFEDGNYMVKEPGDVWRAIMLPHTELGFTAQTVEVMEDGGIKYGEPVIREGKEGRPLRHYDVSEDYKKNVKVIEFHQVEDGNYCVKKINPDDIDKEPPWSDPMWTVWTEELFHEVRIAQGME